MFPSTQLSQILWRTVSRTVSTPLLVTLLAASAEAAAPPTNAANDRIDLDYPELAVTPRATQRLEMESKKEWGRRFTTFLPTQLSSATLLAASIIRLSEGSNGMSASTAAPLPGLIISGGWLVTTIGLSLFHTPYLSGLREISAMPAQSQRDQLAKERMAEEALENAASLGRKLTWLSFATQAGASVYLLTGSRAGELSFPLALASIAAALSPVIFQYQWGHIYNEQMDYKKKIYAPLASGGLMPIQNAVTGSISLVPSVNLTWNF